MAWPALVRLRKASIRQSSNARRKSCLYAFLRTASFEPYGECFQRHERPDFQNVYVTKEVGVDETHEELGDQNSEPQGEPE